MDRLKLFWNDLGTTALVSHRGNLCARRIGLSFSICRMCSVAGPDKAKYRSGVKTININFKAAVFAVVPLALAACAGTQLGETRGLATTGSAFDTALYEGYVGLSEKEYKIGNYTSSDAFAWKAQSAAAGETVLPWTPNDDTGHPPGTVPAADLSEMLKGREDLLQAFTDGGRNVAAQDAAAAQTNYDCWVEEQSYLVTGPNPISRLKPLHAATISLPRSRVFRMP